MLAACLVPFDCRCAIFDNDERRTTLEKFVYITSEARNIALQFAEQFALQFAEQSDKQFDRKSKTR